MDVGIRRVAQTFAYALLVTAGLGVLPAAAQESDSDASQTWQMTAVAGAGGWVSPTEPLPLRINLSSDLLLVGRIDVSIGNATTSQAVEVPAGGVKDYFITAATPGQRRQVRVQLISDEQGFETVLETLPISLRVPADEIVVGVINADAYESNIRGATSKPIEQDVELVRMSKADIANLNSAFSYLVLPAPAMNDLSDEDVELVRAWVSDGGRLIGAATNVSRIVDPAGGSVYAGVGAVGLPVGRGDVTAVNDFDSIDADGWGVLLRSVPQPGIVRVQDDGGQSSLIGAALSSRSASVPALPWLLLGILLFVVLVGPVNFIVLRAFGKPEWAWVTVPLLSAIFVAGFWVVGRSQLQPFTVTHTSVVLQTEDGSEGHTAFVLQVESGGEHELRMNEGWDSQGENFPGATPGVTNFDEAGRATVTYELEDLGVGTAQGVWADSSAVDLGFTVEAANNGFTVTVDNRSGAAFDIWGLVVDGTPFVGSDELLADAQASVTGRVSNFRNNRFQPVIMDAVERRAFRGDGFYENEYQQVYPMAVFAERLAPALKENGIHFFGFTEDTEYGVEIDGQSAASTGRALILLEVPDDGSFLAAKTSARPRLLSVDGSSSVEQYFDEIYAYGADAVFFHYTVPVDLSTGQIDPGFTGLSESSVYDWTSGEFVDFAWGEQLDIGRLASPTGEIVIRAGRDPDREFFDESINLSRFNLSWG